MPVSYTHLDVYKRQPYRPTVVLWFDKSLTMSDRYQILQVTLHEYWLHKTIIVYPSQVSSLWYVYFLGKIVVR